ncbi:MAG: iron-sulfur cluster insertion protein ErpA [Gammaproteobacteria bacterium]|nr:iron-sulfur cluster insertion protein ErpA [Gammaproteobacteria bacterium]
MSDVVFTQKAANKVGDLICEEGNLKLNLRLYITGGGCSGFQYGFAFDENINPDDLVVTKDYDNPSNPNNNQLNQVKLVIDPLSLQYLESSEVDYKEDLQGSQFVIRNPNAKTTCGCGSSFALGDE